MDNKAYTHMKLPSSRESHILEMVIDFEATKAILTSPLCTDPMLPLVVSLAIFKPMLASNHIAPKNKAQVIEEGDYLAK